MVHRHLPLACRLAGVKQREMCRLCGVEWHHWRRVLQGRAVLTTEQARLAAAILSPWVTEASFPRDPHGAVSITPELLRAVRSAADLRDRR